jgi:effector-binding domain-containing protein
MCGGLVPVALKVHCSSLQANGFDLEVSSLLEQDPGSFLPILHAMLILLPDVVACNACRLMIHHQDGGGPPMISEPKLEDRNEQHYVAIRSQTPMNELDHVIPQSLGEVFAWLGKQGIAPAGAPLVRYLVINMMEKLDIEVGVPVANVVSGEGHIHAGTLPAGRYASLVYTGIDNGIKANAALLDWGAQKGLVWDSWETESGDAFGARFESFLTNPDEEPDRAKWETEVAIRLADK